MTRTITTALFGVLTLGACDGGKPSPAPETPAPEAKPAAAPVAAEATPATPAATPSLAATGATCAPIRIASFAGLHVEITDVDAACVARPGPRIDVNVDDLDIKGDVASLAWIGDTLYLGYESENEAPAVVAIDRFLASDRSKPRLLKTPKRNQSPEGVYGGALVSQAGKAWIEACEDWEEDNEEEWHCASHVFFDVANLNGKALPAKTVRWWQPLPKKWTALAGTAVELRSTKAGDECRHAGKTTKLDVFAATFGSSYGAIPIAGDEWLFAVEQPASRSSASRYIEYYPVKGCAVATTESTYATPGPGSYLLVAETLRHGPSIVVTLDNKPFKPASSAIAWGPAPTKTAQK